MDTDDIRTPLKQMRDAFMEFDRFRSNEARHILWHSYDVAGRFWDGFHAVMDQLKAIDAESDEITEAIYEDALCDDEPWAVEAHEYRRNL